MLLRAQTYENQKKTPVIISQSGKYILLYPERVIELFLREGSGIK